MEHKQSRAVTVLDQIGPPNVLLINRGGGRFEPAPDNNMVGLWRNSLQATWCDFNLDGKPDLYIPNDWGPNVLFRNDGPAGFTDVTTQMGLTCYGFSMGASFGDYDNDGRDDLYVSNMYSEAGRRITARIPRLNPMFAEAANGNFLYHREADGKFKQVAGLDAPAMRVKNVGWSWGGCFADFDNDGFLDLYVMSGYFTAPKELSSGVDLESNLWRTMVRADENLSPGFRFSPEWKRTPAPDNFGPEIDARLAGVERQGDKILVHSLHGGERNRYFANRGGSSFVDISGLSGLDISADSRGFAILDYDRDGWQDVALVDAKEPLFNLYHNEMAAVGLKGGMIALRFIGGNKTPAPSKEFACRDGYGASVTVDLGIKKSFGSIAAGRDGLLKTPLLWSWASALTLTLLPSWCVGRRARRSQRKPLPKGLSSKPTKTPRTLPLAKPSRGSLIESNKPLRRPEQSQNRFLQCAPWTLLPSPRDCVFTQVSRQAPQPAIRIGHIAAVKGGTGF
jgi:hypothetical protein